MDIQMPVLDGIGAAQRLRALGHGPDTLPIVALSANVYQSDIDACAAAGMQAHLAKPVRRDALERAIATWARPRATRAASPAPVLDPVPESSAPPAALVERYRTRKAELADALHRFDLAAAEDPATVAALVADIHKFAGTAGHFGDDEAGDAARETERAMAEASPHERIILAHNLRERIETVSHGDAI
jgi:DNA-binding response OmpR family regulator